MTELATGYISLVVETSKIPGQVNQAMRGIEAQADKTGKSWGDKFSAGAGTLIKSSAAAIGVAAGGALATAMTKGVGRLSAIESAEAKLSGLGHSADTVAGIMDNALAAVKGTSFGMDEAATAAAGAVAANIKPGQDLERTLRLVGDAATIAGTDMSTMGSIVNKVATADMMQMDVANQLMDAGIPILQMVASEMGVTAAEARKLASEGKISFETFQSALEAGLGGAAQEAGATTVGAFRNMNAAVSRLGATLAGPFYNQAGGAFRAITAGIDAMDEAAGPAMDHLDELISNRVVPGLQNLAREGQQTWKAFASSELATTSMVRVDGILSQLLTTAKDLADPLLRITMSLGEAAGNIGISTWQIFLSALEASASILDATLVPALDLTADLMQDNQAAVTALMAGFLAFKTIPGILGQVTGAVRPIAAQAVTSARAMSSFGDAVKTSWQWSGQMHPQLGLMGRSMLIMGANGLTAQNAMTKLGAAGRGVLNVFGGPLGAAMTGATIAITSGIAANQRLESAQRELESSSQDLAMAQVDMWNQIGDASGVADAVVDQVKAVNDAIAAGVAGEQKGFGANVSAWWGDLTSADLWTWDLNPQMTGTAGSDAQDQANAIAEASRRAQDSLREIQMTDKEVAAAISGSAGDWDAFVGRLQSTSNGGADAIGQLQPLRDEFLALQRAQEMATPGTLELASAVDVLADSTSSGNDQLNALKTALQALGILETDAENSMFELADAVDRVVESATQGADAAGGLGDALLDASGKLDPTKANARALHDELGALGDQFLATSQATGDAQGAYDALAPALEALATKYNLPIEKIRELAEAAGMAPEQVDMMLNLQGADESRQKIFEVSQALDQIPDGEPKTVTMRVESEEARTALTNLGLDVQAIEGSPGMVRITADSSVAVAAMSQVSAQLGNLDASQATPEILADQTVFRLTDEQVRADLQSLDLSKVDPEIGAIIQNFINGRDVTLSELARIDATTADPHITAEISEAMQNAKVVNEALNEAARDRTARITTEYYETRVTSTGGTRVGHHYASGGRVLPGFTAGRHPGYKLPSTGPGTEITDGFLGVNSRGIPIARLDASEWVVRGAMSNKFNRVLGLINRDDPSIQHLAGYAEGGRAVRTSDEGNDFIWGRDGLARRPLEGAPYGFGGIHWGDCSAAAGSVGRFFLGLDPWSARFATGNAAQIGPQWGFQPGKGTDGDYRVAFYNGGPGGGHMWATMPDGTNIEMRGGGRGGIIGKDAWGINHPSATNFLHIPVADPYDWSIPEYKGRRGKGLTVGEYGVDRYGGATTFGAGGASQGPMTISDAVGQTAAAFVSALTEDTLGFFGIPNRIPTIVRVWDELHDRENHGGVSEWDIAEATAKVKQLEAQAEIKRRYIDGATSAIDALNASPLGNADPVAMAAAAARLEEEKKLLAEIEAKIKAAEARLMELIETREQAAAVANERISGAESDAELEEAASGNAKVDVPESRQWAKDYDPSKQSEQWRPTIDKVLKEKGQPASYAAAVEKRGNQESRGNPKAINTWDSNAARGTPSKGWMQTIDPTFQAYKDPGYGDIFEVEDNLRASVNYVLGEPKFKGRSLESVYLQAGGYNLGGWIRGMGSGLGDDVPLVGMEGEFMVNAQAAAANRSLLEAINSGRVVTEHARPVPVTGINGPSRATNSLFPPAEGATKRVEIVLDAAGRDLVTVDEMESALAQLADRVVVKNRKAPAVTITRGGLL